MKAALKNAAFFILDSHFLVTLRADLPKGICHTGKAQILNACAMQLLRFALICASMAFASFASFASAQTTLSAAQVRQKIIAESIAAYPGRCPCPYHSARNGSACGGRSAWSRQGGYAPLCYEREISAEMVSRWRQERGASGA